MLYLAWLFLGGLGVFATSAASWLALELTPDDDAAVIVAGTLGFAIWGVWTYGSLNVEYPIEGDPGLAFAEPAITLIGLALALFSGILALTGPIELVSRVRDTRMEDV